LSEIYPPVHFVISDARVLVKGRIVTEMIATGFLRVKLAHGRPHETEKAASASRGAVEVSTRERTEFSLDGIRGVPEK
jgi:hypothetical protein